MNIKRIDRKNFGVAGVIEALLLVALVAIIISTIQLIYIPEIMEQREAEHMDAVSNQFSTLKSMIDIQIMTRSDAPITSMITLGSRELPYFITAKSYGEINIVDNENSRIVIEGDEFRSVPLDTIKYTAYNSYFVDQTYILEGGGIIVEQPDGEPVMRVNPTLSFTNTSRVNIYLRVPIIIGIPGKNNTQGYGKSYIRTNFTGKITYENDTTVDPSSDIKIYTKYPNAWYESITNILGSHVIVSIDPSENPTYVKIEDRPNGNPLAIYITKYDITAQIGPGWIT